MSIAARLTSTRTRRRALFLSSLLIAGILSYALFDSVFTGRAVKPNALAQNAALSGVAQPDVDALLAARSPGARAEGAQSKAKKRLADRTREPITQRVLSLARPPRWPGFATSVPEPPLAFGEMPGLPFASDTGFAPPQPMPIALANFPPTALPQTGTTPRPLPPMGGGGFPPGPAGPSEGNEPPVAPPVPELATWVGLLIGFAVIGFRLRMRGRGFSFLSRRRA